MPKIIVLSYEDLLGGFSKFTAVVDIGDVLV